MEVLGIRLNAGQLAEIKRMYVLKYAPYFKTVTHLAEVLHFSRMAIYRYMEAEGYKDLLELSLGSKMDGEIPKIMTFEDFATDCMEKGSIEISTRSSNRLKRQLKKKRVTENQHVTVKVPVKTRVLQKSHKAKIKPDEKLQYAELVLDLFKSGMTIKDACYQTGVTVQTFYQWNDESSPIYSAPVAAMFRDAKKKVKKILQDELLSQAHISLLSLVKDREVRKTIKYGAVNEQTGEVSVKSVIETSWTREASLPAVLKVLQGIEKTLSSLEEGSKEDEYQDLTDEQLDEQLRQEEERLEYLAQQQLKLKEGGQHDS